MEKETDTGFSQRFEVLVRPDMERAIEIYASLTGANRSSVTRMLWAEYLDAKLPGWRDPGFQRLSND